MDIKELIKNKPKNYKINYSNKTLDMWRQDIVNSDDSGNTISILDEIGDSWWGGVSAKYVQGELNRIGNDKDISVIINSPGGDVFEGIAIYNLLKEHKGNVTVKVIGLAASAASFIAMAGDEIKIAKTAFLMMHNAMSLAFGNKHDFRDLADFLEPFDDVIAGIYADKSSVENAEILKMMDAETWINGSKAIEDGFATAYLDSDEVKQLETTDSDVANIELNLILAKSGVPRNERKRMLQNIRGAKNSTSETATQNASKSNKSKILI